MQDNVPAGPAPGEETPPGIRPAAAGSALPGSLLLLALCAAVYGATLGNGFVNYDDDLYVYGNDAVRQGLSPATLRWALTARVLSNWHPVAWASHLLDVSLFGLDPAGHHAVNVLLHGAVSVLLFLLLRSLLSSTGKALFAAALFAVHPLHVETVAWVSERKDLLCTLFWFLALAAWLWRLRSPTPGRYAAVCALFALALMSKPMAVTFPLTLLLLDWWPLGRHRAIAPAHLVTEKMPLFALSAVSATITWWAQFRGGSIAPLGDIPLWARLANACLAVVSYLGKAFLPRGLSVLYPHPGAAVPLLPSALAALALLALSAAAWRFRRERPWLLWGWLFFLATLLPVLGIVQVGMQSMADRYTYVPLTGIFVAAAWEGSALARRLLGEERGRRAAAAAAAAAVVALAATAALRVKDWRDGETLFTAALAADPGSPVAHNNLGNLRHDRGDAQGAVAHYREALRLLPRYPDAHFNLANALLGLGRVDEAISHYKAALEAAPGSTDILYNLGNAWATKHEWGLAAEAYRDALSADPGNTDAMINLGNSVLEMGDLDGAIGWFREALSRSPGHPVATQNLLRAIALKEKKSGKGTR